MNEKTFHSRQDKSQDRPEAPSWLIDNIAELSKSSRKIHAVYVGFLAYCALTLLTSDHRRLIINGNAHLPIINLDVSLLNFVVIAPVVAIITFVYFQFHVQALKGSVKTLKAKYESIEKERLYPWLIGIGEETEPGLFGKIHSVISQTSMWLLLPIVLFLFESVALRKHDTRLAFEGWLVLSLGLILAFWLWYRYEHVTIKSSKKVSRLDKWLELLIQHRWKCLCAAISVIVLLLMGICIPNENKARIGLFNVNLSGAVLSDKELGSQSGQNRPDLRGLHLEGANLNYANLEGTDLEDVYLQGASLQAARLSQARFINASMWASNLAAATMPGAVLSRANLSKANLNCVDLSGSDLRHVKLEGAFLAGANLKDAKLTKESLSGVVTLWNAKNLDNQVAQQMSSSRPDAFRPPIQRTDEELGINLTKYRLVVIKEEDVNRLAGQKDERVQVGDEVYLIEDDQNPFLAPEYEEVQKTVTDKWNKKIVKRQREELDSNWVLQVFESGHSNFLQFVLKRETTTVYEDDVLTFQQQKSYALLSSKRMTAPCLERDQPNEDQRFPWLFNR